MSDFRFKLGTSVMCNFGPEGWKLGRIIALGYREEHWPIDRIAPYQVALDADHTLIYVPEDDDRYCRLARREDVRISRRADALAPIHFSFDDGQSGHDSSQADASSRYELDCSHCSESDAQPGESYRGGQCQCCHPCPQRWSYVELYSEHYRC